MNPNVLRHVGLVLTLLFCVFASGCSSVSESRHTEARVMTTSTPRVVTLYMIGDSTMANKPLSPPNPERGWGQLLQLYFEDGVRIDNHALNGRSSKSFRDEGRWKPVVDALKAGDYVIIQFGHNDEKIEDPKRGTQPFGSFKENLKQFVKETREHGATPILATPVTRRSFDADGKLKDTHGDYAVAVRQVAADEKVALLDMLMASEVLVSHLGPEESKKLYDWVSPGEYARYPKGLSDNTHFNSVGAARMCDLAAELIRSAVPELASWLKQ